MKHLLLPASLAVAILVTGCFVPGLGVVGSGHLATREMDLKAFSSIEAGSAFVVDVRQGDQFRVVVTADDNLFEYLDVSIAGSTLRLRTRSGIGMTRSTLRAEVTMPALRGVSLSGASRATVTGFRSTENLSLDLSGASNLQGDIQAGDVRLDLSGASRVELKGSGGNLTVLGSGASSALLADLPVRDARINLSGASRAVVNAGGRLDADLSGASRVEYSGQPTLGRMQTSGGSSIRAR